jgi:hypothetical protein
VPRAPPFPRFQPHTTRGKRFEGGILGPEKILAGHFPPLGRFAEKEKRRGTNKSRVFVVEYKFKFEFV